MPTDRTITLEQFEHEMKREGGGAFRRRLRQQLVTAALLLERRAKQNATVRPRRRTARLVNSIRGVTKFIPNGVALIARAGGGSGRSAVRYARLQEMGGVIRPRRARKLAIPVGPAKTAAGVSVSPRSVADLVPVVTRNGHLVLLHKGTGQVWFVLKDEVRIEPTYFMRRALERTRQDLPRIIRDAFDFGRTG